MKNRLLLLVIAAVMFSCSAKKSATTTEVKNPTAANSSSAERDGSSYEKAIVITATGESAGVTAEYAWLRNRYPGYKSGSQSLVFHDKKPYDIIKITTAAGVSINTYFDISNFYGKF